MKEILQELDKVWKDETPQKVKDVFFANCYGLKIMFEINKEKSGTSNVYQELIDRWVKWDTMPQNERHKRIEWYKEYERIYKKLVHSPWQEYAYGDFEPLPHEYFIRSGNGKCRSWWEDFE